jgi:hypothetical protein
VPRVSYTVVTRANNAGKLTAAVHSAAARAVAATAENSQLILREKILRGPKTGRVYTHGPQPLPHQASAPGESPANWTGALQDSIRYQEVPGDGLTWAVVIGNQDGIADFLEHGTVRMAPRPFIEPSLPEIKELLTLSVELAIREVTRG